MQPLVEVFDEVLRFLNEFYIPDSLFKLTTEEVAENLKESCEKKGIFVSGAESVTGGMIASFITSVPGSSMYFRGAVVAYDEMIKQSVLGVSAETIQKYGVVSEETAAEMCLRAASLMKADLAWATTGYAGPEGGDEANPVGTVCFAIGGVRRQLTWKVVFKGSRNEVREKAADFIIRSLYIASINWERCDFN